MDFVTDVSNTMSRNGAIYPYIRALTAGYIGGSGIRRSDVFDVCLIDILFWSNHNVHKSSSGLCFWASNPLNERF